MSNKNNQKGKQKQYTVITILAIVVILSVTLVGIYFTKNKPKEDEKTLAYTDLIKEMSAGNIEKIEMKTGSTTVKVKVKLLRNVEMKRWQMLAQNAEIKILR